MDKKDTLTDEEKLGVEAIIYLQSLAHITEPKDIALANWRNFSQMEKDHTMQVYRWLKPDVQ